MPAAGAAHLLITEVVPGRSGDGRRGRRARVGRERLAVWFVLLSPRTGRGPENANENSSHEHQILKKKLKE